MSGSGSFLFFNFCLCQFCPFSVVHSNSQKKKKRDIACQPEVHAGLKYEHIFTYIFHIKFEYAYNLYVVCIFYAIKR